MDISPKEAIARLKEQMGLRQLLTDYNERNPPYPNLDLDPVLQSKVVNTTAFLMAHGSHPSDIQIENGMQFRYLPLPCVDLLITNNLIPLSNSHHPLAGNYLQLFDGGRYLPFPDNRVRFYAHLIDCLKSELLVVTTLQYYKGMEFDKFEVPVFHFSDPILEAAFGGVDGLRLESVASLNYSELYSRPLLEYMVYTVRAQWDKFTRLLCIGFNIDPNVNSIVDAFSQIDAYAGQGDQDKRFYLSLFTRIGRERLLNGRSWLKGFRDSLAHGTSQSSLGFMPSKKTEETVGILWRKALDEHDYVREAFVTAMLALVVGQKSA